MQQARQGDLLFQKIDSLPENLKVQKSDVLVYGEATGHALRLKEGQIFTNNAGQMFLVLKKASQVLHKEHKPIDLDKGLWAVIRQREYQNKDMVKLIVD